LNKKYQIFVSSTYRDLVDERQAVLKIILDLGHIPAGMEGFPAIDIEQLKYIKKVIDQCDYYVLIVGGRYGSLDVDGESFTEKEYKYAVEKGISVIAFVLEDIGTFPPDKSETNPDVVERLKTFRSHVMTGRMVHRWNGDREHLVSGVYKSLSAAFAETPALGWVRANTVASEDILAQINELRIRNDELEASNARLQSELTPKIKNLASLDSKFLIHFKYTEDIGRATQRPGESSFSMTWRAIFKAIGPELAHPRSPKMISTLLDKFISEKKLVKYRFPQILHATENQIKIQLCALGLIKNFQGRRAAGGLAEWIQLTEYGNRTLFESMAIRADDQSNNQ